MRMWTRWPGQHRAKRGGSSAVVVEAQRLLAGETVQGRGRATDPVRPWMLVNVLAHADRAVLSTLQGAGTRGAPGSWIGTLGYLSSELTPTGLADGDVGDRQRRLLVPLELKILGGEVPVPTSPAQLARLVLDALGQHPMERDR
jgi:hypothetical protein